MFDIHHRGAIDRQENIFAKPFFQGTKFNLVTLVLYLVKIECHPAIAVLNAPARARLPTRAGETETTGFLI